MEPQQLVGGVWDPRLRGFPVADGALTDVEQLGARGHIDTGSEPGLTKAVSSRGVKDRQFLPFTAIYASSAFRLHFA